MRAETQPLPVLDRAVEPSSRRSMRRPTTAPAPGRRLNNAGVFLVVAATISIVGLLYLVQTSQVAGLGYQVSRLEAERRAKAHENQALTYQVAAYEALPRVEQVARGQLAMAPLAAHVFLTVPRPASDELALPPPASGEHRSLAERIWDRLTGEAEAGHPVETGP